MNIANKLTLVAGRLPYRPAIILPDGTIYNFQQLNQWCDYYAHNFSTQYCTAQQRILLMLKPGMELFVATFALLKMGAVPVFIDPGMGLTNFWQCVNEAEPVALISSSRLLRPIIRLFFKKIRLLKLPQVPSQTQIDYANYELAAQTLVFESEAAVVFTSGSTGIPKGVVYSHGMFNAQIQIFRDIGIEEGEVDLPCLYIFAMFNPILGVTTVIPDMDPRHPAKLEPAKLIQAIEKYQVTTSFGSPIIWKKIGDYCYQHKLTLPSMRRIFIAGAPVHSWLIKQIEPLLPNGKILIPYGATEALPLTIQVGDKVDKVKMDGNIENSLCVGKPLNGITLRIIPITDYVVEDWDDSLALPAYSIGEIVVKGVVVTQIYVNRPYQTVLAKIKGPEGEIWHRMGDMGFLDEQGNLWFCGRKSHRVETEHGLLYPIPCEAVFNRHPLVARSALVGVGPRGHQRPVIFIEPKHGGPKIAELLAMGQLYDHTRLIREIMFHPSFPVDVRHNAKIQREKLAIYATHRKGQTGMSDLPYPNSGF